MKNKVIINSIETSKRFYAACAVMQGILASYAGIQIEQFPHEWIVEQSYLLADKLLAQENVEN